MRYNVYGFQELSADQLSYLQSAGSYYDINDNRTLNISSKMPWTSGWLENYKQGAWSENLDRMMTKLKAMQDPSSQDYSLAPQHLRDDASRLYNKLLNAIDVTEKSDGTLSCTIKDVSLLQRYWNRKTGDPTLEGRKGDSQGERFEGGDGSLFTYLINENFGRSAGISEQLNTTIRLSMAQATVKDGKEFSFTLTPGNLTGNFSRKVGNIKFIWLNSPYTGFAGQQPIPR